MNELASVVECVVVSCWWSCDVCKLGGGGEESSKSGVGLYKRE